MDTLDVLVVGAGPNGLTLAAELTRFGLSCRIIDKLAAPSDKSKALVVHARTLEVLDTMGIVQEAIAAGERIEAINFVNKNKITAHIATTGLDSPFPIMLAIAQYDTESVLNRHLNRMGVQVERQIELISFEQNENEVIANLKHPDGTTETVTARWLVGCDGAHSTVRHTLNLPFDGFPYEDNLWLADVHVKWPLPLRQLYNFLSDKGAFMAFPIRGSRYRLLGNIPLAGDKNAVPTLEAIQEVAAQVCPTGTELYDPVWLANFKIHHRKVANYRQGRVFLLGDAAHVHSPAGGQGMNTGMQDAHNLAWKLAFTAKGYAQPALLDSYHAERNAVGEQVLKNTDLMLKMMTVHNPLARTLRNQAVALVANQEIVTDKLKNSLSQLDINYGDSPLTVGNTTAKNGIPAGNRAPEAVFLDNEGRAVRLFELYRNGKFNLLLVAGLHALEKEYKALQEIATSVSQKYADSVAVHLVVGGVSRPAELAGWSGSILHDAALSFHERYGSATTSAYLLRPDGYVGFSSQPANAADLESYLSRLLLTQSALAQV